VGKSNDDYRNLSRQERLRLAEHIYISYPRLNELLQKIEYCHQYSKLAAEPKCMLITGESGVGKTTLFSRYQQKFPRYETEDGTTVPVLSTIIEVPATVKNLATALLTNLGDPEAERGTSVTMTLRARRLLEDCGVELIILDEFQHFIDRDSKKVLMTVSDWLKNFLNETKKPMVLIGMPNSAEILDANKQLRRRFAMRESLKPVQWDTLEHQREFRQFLQILDKRLPLVECSHLSDGRMAFRFYKASHGLVSSVMKIAVRATALALEASMEKLTLETLAKAYEDELRAANQKEVNPFLP
jgi:Cdc6-like AAA superfamily ATPase